MYTTTDQIKVLADDQALQENCLKTVATKGNLSVYLIIAYIT